MIEVIDTLLDFATHLMRNMCRWRLTVLALLVFGCALSVWPPVPGQAQDNGHDGALVTDVRVGHTAGKAGIETTRIVMDVDNKLDYRWFTLPDPHRVVLDFGPLHFAKPLNQLAIPQGALITGMRAGVFSPGVIRMVLDQKKPARVNVFKLPAKNAGKGERIVIDVVTLRPGQKATNVPPPAEVVDKRGMGPLDSAGVPTKATSPQVAAETEASVPAQQQQAPVVPRKVDQNNKRSAIVVTLDAGHGGVDPGGCGKKLCEKNLVLDVVKKIGANLERQGIRVVYTRDRDIFIPLAERTRIAQRAEADLFVSIHADIHPSDRSVKGATVYRVSEKASDREAQRLADSENSGDILAGVGLEKESKEVQSILLSLVQRETINSSSYLGQSILGELGDATTVRKKQLLFAGFKVLKAPDVPSVLVELGYLSNPQEEKLLMTDAYRNKLAAAVAQGIGDYVRVNVHR